MREDLFNQDKGEEEEKVVEAGKEDVVVKRTHTICRPCANIGTWGRRPGIPGMRRPSRNVHRQGTADKTHQSPKCVQGTQQLERMFLVWF